jgi:hypothetical protein
MFLAERNGGFGRLQLGINVAYFALEHCVPGQRIGQAEGMR